MGRQLTTGEFIAKAKTVHGDKYDYSKVEYKGQDVKVEIICPQHGVFSQTPHNHLRGQKCPKCAIQGKMSTTEKFVTKAREVHGDKYDFSSSVYLGVNKEIQVTCKKCGNVFNITPLSLITGNGCRMCDFSDDRRVYCLDGEEWRDVNGFDGYQVSNMGALEVLIE